MERINMDPNNMDTDQGKKDYNSEKKIFKDGEIDPKDYWCPTGGEYSKPLNKDVKEDVKDPMQETALDPRYMYGHCDYSVDRGGGAKTQMHSVFGDLNYACN